MNCGEFLVYIILMLILLSYISLAQERDTLYLRNGQIMVGKLYSISLGIIQFEELDLFVQNVKYLKIKAIKTGMATYRIQTIDQAVYYGVLKPSPMYGEVVVDASSHLINHRGKQVAIKRRTCCY